MIFFEPESRDTKLFPWDPFKGVVVPRPIGWISSMNKAGQVNLAPYSFFNLYSYKPPIVGFCSTGWKDSVQNVKDTGEFVWNLATRDLAEAMNETSAALPHGADEFERAPRVQELRGRNRDALGAQRVDERLCTQRPVVAVKEKQRVEIGRAHV